MTKLARLTLLFSLVDMGLFVWLVAQTGRVSAQDVPAVLRGRGLEIVDDQGRIRASITRYGKSDGGTYNDIVVFRLHDEAGKPMIKLDTHVSTSGLKASSHVEWLFAPYLPPRSCGRRCHVDSDSVNEPTSRLDGDGQSTDFS